MVYSAEWLNRLGAAHWREFATQDYFDKSGVFVGATFCACVPRSPAPQRPGLTRPGPSLARLRRAPPQHTARSPLLCVSMFILLNALRGASKLLIEVKRKQIVAERKRKRKAEKAE